MRNNSQARSKLLMLLAILVLVLLIQGVVHVYRDMETHGAARKYASASVSYGTHYQATSMPPMVQSPSLRRTAVAVPMASGAVVHSTPYTLHTSPSSFTIHTTSSAEVRSVGSGGGGGGGIATTNGSSSSRRGMTYSGASVAMPTLALATPSMAAEPSMAEPRAAGPRRIQANGDGSYHGETKEENGNTYYWDEDLGWVNNTPIGTTKTENGQTYEWDGSYWVIVKGTDPYVPVGPMPWLFMAVLAAGYICWKRRSSLGLLSVFSR